MSEPNRGIPADLADAREETDAEWANRVNASSCLTRAKRRKVESPLAELRSRALREAVTARFNESPKLLTDCAPESIPEQLENIARGEMLRMLPLWIQAWVFSFISVEERVRVLETISGGQAAGQGTQANFRRAVLETYKSVKTVKDFGTKWSKLRLLQATGGLENLRTRFPKLQVNLNRSVLQGFIQCIDSTVTVSGFPLTGREISINVEPAVWKGSVIFVQMIDPTSFMMIDLGSKAVRLINLVDHSVRNCAPMLHKHDCGAAAVLNGFVYVVGNGYLGDDHPKCCERYNLQSDSWERIADMNYGRFRCQVVVWKDSLYAVGGMKSDGTVECYDPEKNAWTVVFNEIKNINEPVRHSTIVAFDDNLFYFSSTARRISVIDMRTGETTNLRAIKEADIDSIYSKQYYVYVENEKVCLLRLLDNGPHCVQWRIFHITSVLNRSQKRKWQTQSIDSGVVESMQFVYRHVSTTPLLL